MPIEMAPVDAPAPGPVAACKALAVVAVIGAACALIYCVIVEIADGMIW